MKRTLSAVIVAAALIAGCGTVPAVETQAESETPYNLGVDAFRSGDYAKAAANWESSVASDDPHAINNLGFLLFHGQGVAKDVPRALSLWRTAATRQISESQLHLGEAYASGTGVPKDRVEAYAWIRTAIESAARYSQDGTDTTEEAIAEDARQALAKLVDKLSPEEFGAAQKRALDYINRYSPMKAEKLRA